MESKKRKLRALMAAGMPQTAATAPAGVSHGSFDCKSAPGDPTSLNQAAPQEGGFVRDEYSASAREQQGQQVGMLWSTSPCSQSPSNCSDPWTTQGTLVLRGKSVARVQVHAQRKTMGKLHQMTMTCYLRTATRC
jgi:hypothetical protein